MPNNNQRNKMPAQDPAVRAKNFEEVALGYDLSAAMAEAARCLNCKGAPCKNGCPVGVNIPEFLSALKNGDAAGAAAIIKATNGLPSVCGRVCPQENQCEKLCVRGVKGEPVAIGACERFAGDFLLVDGGRWMADGKEDKNTLPPPSSSLTPHSSSLPPHLNHPPHKAAIIGSGPASLSCAAELCQNGVAATVFEAFHKPGGVLAYGIPEFRLPKSVVRQEIDALASLGVVFRDNTVVGKTVTPEELLEAFDAVFIGTGAGLPVFLGIPGENLNGSYSANEYLTRVNLMQAYKPQSGTPIKIGKNVIVVGAGNVAMDAARTALRLGAETVTVVYRRSRAEMPARREEILHAEEEGIRFEFLTNPVEIIGENGFVKGVKCVRMVLGEPDASGRRAPAPIEGSEFMLDADLFITALGNSPNPLLKESWGAIATGKKGVFTVDENHMTNIPGVYAGGDAVTGAATVISAMGAGRAAAKAIVKRLAATTEV